MANLEEQIGVTHTSFIVTSRIDNYTRLYLTNLLFRGFDIQSHGYHHENLANITDMNSLRESLSRSIRDIERIFGFTPIIYAYPYGNASYAASDVAISLFDVARGVMGEPIFDLGK